MNGYNQFIIKVFLRVTLHETYISRCLQLASNGLGTTHPNPLVGSVVVCDGRIIGEGWHQKAGEPHAEVHAINSVTDKSLLKRSVLYVNLEPCSHFGRTPPCCDLIIKHKIPEVVIGTVDPHSVVSGNGIAKLTAAGVNVHVGVLEQQCDWLNRRFFTFQTKKRPYIILKWAESADGYIAPLLKTEKQPVWISNKYSRQLVHKWRSEEQAVLVGTQTVIDDDPQLTIRDWAGNNPVRVVLDRNNRLSKELKIFSIESRTILISETARLSANNKIIDFNRDLACQICTVLFEESILSVIIEGGKKTLETFIEAGLWDEARVFKSAVSLSNGIKAPVFENIPNNKCDIAGDELLIYVNHDQYDNL